MKPGQPFNPRFEACGFHPEEIVARRRDLADGQKWLYDCMVRWARASDGEREKERAGEVWRSRENMASELGKSAKQVGRDVARIEVAGLMTHRKRDGRKANTYVFLHHIAFVRTSTSSQTEGRGEIEPTPVTGQTTDPASSCPVVIGRPRPVRSDLTGHARPTNQKELIKN
ncbi:MAG TPA: hypothetical protein VGR73_18035 [Bryobacteraceae bacterium]|nr:hypothetical protein [Bryobacteraceae bacterium]